MRKPLLMAIIMGLFAAIFIALYLNSIEVTYKKGSQKVKVLTAKQYVDQGTIIDDSIIEEKLVPKDYIQPKAVSSIKELLNSEGRYIYFAIVPIEKGEQIITTKLSMLGLDTGVSAVIPTDKRAFTLALEKESISGIIKPGNRVDIICILEYEDKNSQIQEAAITLLQNVLVLSSGNSIIGALKPIHTSKIDLSKDMMQESADTGSIPITFAVSPYEAELLAVASEKGSIKLSLRPIGDDKINELQGTKLKDISKDMALSSRSLGNSPSGASQEYYKEMQKKQREVMDLLKKYQK